MVYRGIELYARGLKNSRLRSKITISKITPQDNADLAHLFAENYKRKQPIESHEFNQKAEWINLFETYQKKGFAYFVMKMESKIIGGAGISPGQSGKSPVCVLEKTCINSDMLHLRLEKMIIDTCLKEAKRLGYEQCYVDTAKEILFSKEFFFEMGFHTLKENKQKVTIL